MSGLEVNCAARAGPEPIPVLLLVSGLQRGGAERQVVHLANRLDRGRFDVAVCSLSPHVPLAADLHERERRLYIIEKTWRFDASTVQRAADLMRDLRSQIVHAFLFDAEIVARLAGRRADVPVVIASERNADYRRPLVQRLGQRLTRSCYDGLIANSRAGKRFAMQTLGLPQERVFIVPNGVDTGRFAPGDGLAARAALGLDPRRPVVGMVASFKPQKNYLMFLYTAQALLERMPDVQFVSVGAALEPERSRPGAARAEPESALSRFARPGSGQHGDTSAYQRLVHETIGALDLHDRVCLLGVVNDMPAFYRACDVIVLTSRHEGTPNVLLEAMASGVPVVATDVADNRLVIPAGRAGFTIPLDDAQALADRLWELLTDGASRAACGAYARAWVQEHFSIDALAERTGTIYLELLREKLAARAVANGRTPRLAFAARPAGGRP